MMGGEKQQVNGEVSSDHGSAATADSGRGPSEDGATPATDDGTSVARLIRNKKYILWNVYLPNVVAFHTPLSKYLTVIVMTLN